MPYRNIEDQRRNTREYYKKNKEEVKRKQNKRYAEKYARDPEFRKEENRRTEECRKKQRARIQMETPWLLHLDAARIRCTYPKQANYKWYGGKGVRMLLTELEAEILYKIARADKMKQPSIDRINSKGDYHFGNCRFIELSENVRRQHDKM